MGMAVRAMPFFVHFKLNALNRMLFGPVAGTEN
jgi:hypothetical protein